MIEFVERMKFEFFITCLGIILLIICRRSIIDLVWSDSLGF
jgi:hypothetical protein